MRAVLIELINMAKQKRVGIRCIQQPFGESSFDCILAWNMVLVWLFPVALGLLGSLLLLLRIYYYRTLLF